MTPDVERAVRAEILRLLEQQGKPGVGVSADDSLSDTLGLTSLDVVELIVALNARLGADPFKQRAFSELDYARQVSTGVARNSFASPPTASSSFTTKKS